MIPAHSGAAALTEPLGKREMSPGRDRLMRSSSRLKVGRLVVAVAPLNSRVFAITVQPHRVRSAGRSRSMVPTRHQFADVRSSAQRFRQHYGDPTIDLVVCTKVGVEACKAQVARPDGGVLRQTPQR